MKNEENKLKTVFAIFLMLSMTASVLLVQTTSAHTPPWQIDTYAYLEVEPNPIGVGQQAFVSFGIDKVPMTVSTYYGDRWTNLTITITKPDGTTQQLSGFTADDTGFAYTTFTPDKVGNYTFVCNFGGQTLVGANPPPAGFSSTALAWIGDYYKPSVSDPRTLSVQNEPVGTLPFNPLPKDYWQRPINMMNNNWNTISGNWLGLCAYTNGGYGYNMTTNFNPYTTAPNTAHILWTKPMAPGGLIGGEYGGTLNSNFYSTPQYEMKFKAVVLNGVLYYTSVPGSSTNTFGTVAVNLLTGQELWTKTMNGTLRCGQIYNYISPNQYGGLAYLWSISGSGSAAAFSMYDAMTGNWILDVTGSGSASSGAFVSGEDDGSLLVYYVNSTDNTINAWNSSRCILRGPTGTGDPHGWSWRPSQGAKLNWTYGIEWTKPLATTISGQPISPILAINQLGSNVILLDSKPNTGYYWSNWQIEAGYSTINGNQLWLVNRTLPSWTMYSGSWVNYASLNGKYYAFCNEPGTFYCFDLATGEKVWGPSEPMGTGFWAYIDDGARIAQVAYGTLYASDFAGNIYAYNASTGEKMWTFNAGNAEYNTGYGSWPIRCIEAIADGKVFAKAGHVYNPPLFRGSHYYCLNATTGELIWKVLSFCQGNGAETAISDGVLLTPNGYDNQIYAFGKGQSATTVTASPKVPIQGSSVLIEGSVTDQSPGQTCLGKPAKGTPAISDADQELWMEYLYEQQPMPTNATGVPVTISVVDSNGNNRQIGQTTSNVDGFFTLTWTPDILGNYTVTANFAGTQSFYPSHALTSFTVDQPATTAPTSTLQPVSLESTQMYIIGIGVAIIIAIAIGFTVTILALRKRP